MPKDWRWLLTYWATEPQLAVDASPDIEWDCDAALCPTHVLKLNSQLATAILSRIPGAKPNIPQNSTSRETRHLRQPLKAGIADPVISGSYRG